MRRADWPEILAALLARARAAEFAWGEHDCCLFAADVVRAITGRDPAAAFRGRYRTRRGAQLALKRYGRGTLLATVTAILGEPVPPLLARRGDVLYMDGPQGPAMGVCSGPRVMFPTRPRGLVAVHPLSCSHAWRID